MSLTLIVSILRVLIVFKSALSKISILTSTWTLLDLNGIDMSLNPKLISKSRKQSVSIQTFSRTQWKHQPLLVKLISSMSELIQSTRSCSSQTSLL